MKLELSRPRDPGQGKHTVQLPLRPPGYMAACLYLDLPCLCLAVTLSCYLHLPAFTLPLHCLCLAFTLLPSLYRNTVTLPLLDFTLHLPCHYLTSTLPFLAFTLLLPAFTLPLPCLYLALKPLPCLSG